MATIIETLVMEHVVFRAVFDEIERVLPGLNSTQEVKVLSTVVERVLGQHAETETDLAYAALDHVLAQKGELNHLYQDHKEIDHNFKRVRGASSLAEAQRLLKKALAASREHFRHEERVVFPLLERALPSETLIELGETWAQEYPAVAP
ncbi:MAG: hemerythrin domain-containing protein [Verrucomicrobiota bacterium]